MIRSVLRHLFCGTATGALLLSTSATAQRVPSGFTVDTVLSSGIDAPIDFAWLPDGRMLIAQRNGQIKVWIGSGTPTVVGVQNGVRSGSERGLLSVIPDPNFVTNGYIYMWYSRTGSRMTLVRHTLIGDLNNPTSTNLAFSDERRLVDAPDSAFNHNGGTVRFGPDGMLYVSIGDDANSCSAQSTTSIQGVMLRLDVSTVAAGGSLSPPALSSLAAADNPFPGDAVFAYGLRNPWRFEIDSVTGNLYIGDVGQNAWEEVDELPGGGNQPRLNFGWPWREGNASFGSCGGSTPPGLVPPMIAISQSQGWLSVLCGPRYRNQSAMYDFGPSYEGDVFYADYSAGDLRRLSFNGSTWSPAPAVPGQPNSSDWGTGFTAIAAMRQGPDGCIYLCQHAFPNASSGGSLKCIRPIGPQPSTVLVSGGSQYAAAGQPYAQPLVFEVRDVNNNPVPGGTINFNLTGEATLSATSAIADANGRASVTVTTLQNTVSNAVVQVRASTPGGDPIGTSVELYRRNLIITATPVGATVFVVVTVGNHSPATSPQIPFVMTFGADNDPGLPSPIGLICPNPLLPTSIVFEDGLGSFGNNSLRPGGPPVGTPGFTVLYQLPSGILTGRTFKFQGIGFDAALSEFFITDTERVVF